MRTSSIRRGRVVLLLTVIVLCLAGKAFAQDPDALFQQRCAQCHSAKNNVNAPLPETLRLMRWQAILTALESGKMKGVGDALTAIEREVIAKRLGTAAASPMAESSKCQVGVALDKRGPGDGASAINCC